MSLLPDSGPSEEALEKFGTFFDDKTVVLDESEEDAEDDEDSPSEEESFEEDADSEEEEPDESVDDETEPPYTDDQIDPDQLSLAYQRLSAELEAERTRAAEYQEHISHLVNQLQTPPPIPFSELSEEWQNPFIEEAAKWDTSPAEEYRRWRQDLEASQHRDAITARSRIKEYFDGHPEREALGPDVMSLLDRMAAEGNDILSLPSYLPPDVLVRDAQWRINSLFQQAKLERIMTAQRAASQRKAKAEDGAQRAKMKAAARTEATRPAASNRGTATSSQRPPEDEIREGFRKAAKTLNHSLL